MEIGSPQDWAQGAGAFKSAVEAIGGVIRIMRDLGGRKATPEEQDKLDEAIVLAEKAAKIADAQTAKALGYELCHCQLPPTAMLTVGHMAVRGSLEKVRPVHECPSCGYCDAGPYGYDRIAPRWQPPHPREVVAPPG